jgi:hypothetical protein
MTIPDNTHDRFELRLFGRTNPLKSWDAARPILETLLREGGDLAPTTFWERHDKGEPLTLDAVRGQLDRRKPADVLFFSNEYDVAVEWAGFQGASNPASKLLVRIPFPLLADHEHMERLLALTTALCRVCPPVYGWGHSEEDARLGKDPHITNPWAPKTVVEMYWLTVIGAAMVRKLKRAHVAATPAYRVDILDDGSALIVTSPLPDEMLSPAAREAQANALAHLRSDRPADRILRELLDRSARLQPVERCWDPDLAEIFRIIVESVPLSERRAKELEFNAYHPPDITEWRAASEAVPTDVDDVAAAVDSYHRQGQTFVARFHDEIPGLMAAEPEVLSRVDAYFYLGDHLRGDLATLERLMLPTLGAYLGTMLERQLDGQWVPRRNVEESQVIVGDRAWLPFLRVKRFLQSKPAVVDYSLAKYYREAERYAPNVVP